MSELKFSQPERRNFLVPILIAVAVLGGAIAYLYLRTPFSIADVTVTHTNILPTHTVFKTGSIVLGRQETAEDDLYVLTTVHVDNHLKVPLFLSDITGNLTGPDDSSSDTSAIQQSDLPNLYITFPALKPLAGDPLLRESTIPPGGHAEGMVLLHFPLTQTDWDNRKSATVTVEFYHQGSATATIPKEQGTGNSK
jgi:hypothetical protein